MKPNTKVPAPVVKFPAIKLSTPLTVPELAVVVPPKAVAGVSKALPEKVTAVLEAFVFRMVRLPKPPVEDEETMLFLNTPFPLIVCVPVAFNGVPVEALLKSAKYSPEVEAVVNAAGLFTVRFPFKYKVVTPILNSPVAVAVVPAEFTVRFPKIPTADEVTTCLLVPPADPLTITVPNWV